PAGAVEGEVILVGHLFDHALTGQKTRAVDGERRGGREAVVGAVRAIAEAVAGEDAQVVLDHLWTVAAGAAPPQPAIGEVAVAHDGRSRPRLAWLLDAGEVGI